jgi:hypothetical protein
MLFLIYEPHRVQSVLVREAREKFAALKKSIHIKTLDLVLTEL